MSNTGNDAWKDDGDAMFGGQGFLVDSSSKQGQGQQRRRLLLLPAEMSFRLMMEKKMTIDRPIRG
jgi:hypothetical protein